MQEVRIGAERLVTELIQQLRRKTMVSWTRELVRNGRLFRFCVYFNMWKYG